MDSLTYRSKLIASLHFPSIPLGHFREMLLQSVFHPNYPEPTTNPTEEPPNVTEQTKLMSTVLVQASKKFDLLVAALPLSDGGEEAQLKRSAELEAENEAVGRELQKQPEAAEEELKQVQDLFHQAADNCLNLKKLD